MKARGISSNAFKKQAGSRKKKSGLGGRSEDYDGKLRESLAIQLLPLVDGFPGHGIC